MYPLTENAYTTDKRHTRVTRNLLTHFNPLQSDRLVG
jgi:hypothetical protein